MDLAFWLQLALFIILLGFSAFFSSSETALFSLSRTQIERLRLETGRSSKIVATLLNTPRRVLITILVGNMFVNVASASLVASFATVLLGNKGVGIAAGDTIGPRSAPDRFGGRYEPVDDLRG